MSNDIPSQVRVRFAPSPTGYLHVGGLRTALYNFLFARKHGGTFILRIEDTDRTRFVEGAQENLMEVLHWAGIHFDEGPGVGGDHGPYVQSERQDIYVAHASRLLELGHAYRCFCPPRPADERTHQSAGQVEDPCRRLDPADAAGRAAAGDAHTIRLRVPCEGVVPWHDVLHGDMAIDVSEIDDQVLLKTDGFPTYHLANVVDDHLMGITHVIRGEEWLPSTPKHVLLYNAFGWAAPVFVHLPLLLNADRRKLSKREGDVAVEAFRDKGYLPEALVNFIALLGWHGADDREIYTLDELSEAFSLERISSSGAVFNVEKLNWFNAHHLAAMDEERRLTLAMEHCIRAGRDVQDRGRMAGIVAALAGRFSTMEEFVAQSEFFFSDHIQPADEESAAIVARPGARAVLQALHGRIGGAAAWTGEEFKARVKDVQQELGVKGRDLFMPIRIALSGSMHGPDLGAIAEILGPEETARRIGACL